MPRVKKGLAYSVYSMTGFYVIRDSLLYKKVLLKIRWMKL